MAGPRSLRRCQPDQVPRVLSQSPLVISGIPLAVDFTIACSPEAWRPNLKPELLLFDFGGVLVEFAGPRELGQHLRWSSTPETILKRWTECQHTEAFERGKLSPAEWAGRFIQDWDVDLAPDEFLKKFTTWSRRVLPGAKELLEELRPRYRLAALSNSNELHWERNTNELRIIELFEFAISSHQLGLCKPVS